MVIFLFFIAGQEMILVDVSWLVCLRMKNSLGSEEVSSENSECPNVKTPKIVKINNSAYPMHWSLSYLIYSKQGFGKVT